MSSAVPARLAIGADELHYRGDIILNFGVIATLAIGNLFPVPLLDPLFGGAVGVWIIYSAVKIARLSLTQLMDRELPDQERARIRAIAESHPEVAAVHDIRTRVAGPTAFIQLHIEMDGAMNLLRAHEISDAVEARAATAPFRMPRSSSTRTRPASRSPWRFRPAARRDDQRRERAIARLKGAARPFAAARARGASKRWRHGTMSS